MQWTNGKPVMADKRQNYYSDKSTNDAITIDKRSKIHAHTKQQQQQWQEKPDAAAVRKRASV